jgi:hypothetical protein
MSNSSSSKSKSSSSTVNNDKRVVADGGSLGVSGDSVTVNVSDQQAIQGALQFAEGANAIAGTSYEKLLDVASGIFEGAATAVSKAQDQTASAYQTAVAEKSGTVDNKTIMVVALAAAGVMALKAAKK